MIGKGKQELKRSKSFCLKTDGSATDPATIQRSVQNSRGRAAKKGEDEGSPAMQGRGSAEGVKRRTCKREDGKGWRCGNEAKAGSTLCEHHLSQVRSYCKRPSNDSSKRRSPSMPEGEEGRRKKRPSAQSSSWWYGAAAAAAGGYGVKGEEGGEDGGKGKIKGRKRVKCQSLESLL